MTEMKVEIYKVPQTVAVVRNFYTPEELELIWNELSVICSPYLLQPEKNTGAAYDPDNEAFLKKGSGLFIDRIYEDRREVSHILSFGRKVFNEVFIDSLIEHDPNFWHLRKCNQDHTLVNYYENGDEYKQHSDSCVFTANIVLWREPKKFDGGVFLIKDGEAIHDFKLNSNDMVLFPGYTPHTVTQITMHQDFTPWYSGRYSIANFISYR